MSWERVIKDDTPMDYRPIIALTMEKLKPLLNHPNYNAEHLEKIIGGNNKISLLRSLIEHIDNPDNFPIEEYLNRLGGHRLVMMNMEMVMTIIRTLEEATLERSWGFLNSVAETFGVTISRYTSRDHDDVVRFSHRGLEFELFRGGVRINIRRINKQIIICVVDEKRLPIGDFYASMLGLVVAKPEELDVVNFGIQLALIMLQYTGYNWQQTPTPSQISIYTPFTETNRENLAFTNWVYNMMQDDHDLASDILDEIEGALEDCFGSTRGFF